MNIKNGSMAMVKILEIVSERLNSPEAAMAKVLETISERAERQPGEEG